MRGSVILTIALALAAPATASAGDLYVSPAAAGCSDSATLAAAAEKATPWCSPAPALSLARPGDVVHLASATYHVQWRPLVSGTQAQPVTYEADGPVTVLAPPGSVSIMLTGVHDIVLRGLTVRASAPQAIWIDDATRILLDRMTVANDAGVGVQVKRGLAVTVTRSRLINNARAGLLDMAQARGTVLSSSTVSDNGHDGRPYDGDGVELDSSNATVTGNRITHNGDSRGFEHGIYAGHLARAYTISGNTIGANAGADIKAAGGPGLVAGNRLLSSLFGLVVSDNPVPVTAQYNLIQGRFQHGVMLTTGSTAARARLWNNTVQQTGRSTGSGKRVGRLRGQRCAARVAQQPLRLHQPGRARRGLDDQRCFPSAEVRGDHQLVLERRRGRAPPGLERLARDVRAVARSLAPGCPEHRLGATGIYPRRACGHRQPWRLARHPAGPRPRPRGHCAGPGGGT